MKFLFLIIFCLSGNLVSAQDNAVDLQLSDLKSLEVKDQRSSSTNLKLSQFETDYCTMFFEGTVTKPALWKECCFNHDLRYWFGGSKNEQLKSDQILKQCVRKKAGSFWANIMYSGVRAGHYSPVKNKYQWGWGWEKRKAFKSLSTKEKQHIKSELSKLNLEENFLEEFIKKYNL